MRCEIIAVGTELLLGQIVDTNSSWIGEQLALAGIDVHFQTRVGDNLQRIVTVVQMALARNEAVILCGGLGPTQDDITREAIARVMRVRLVRDEQIVERIRAKFADRGRIMPENNLRQAEVPEGVSIIPQMPGTAPGLICPVGDKVMYAVPGVPGEMQEMIAGTVIPDLQRRAGGAAVIMSRTLRTWGQSESGIAEMLAARIQELDNTGNPTLAFLASGIEGIKVRITVKTADRATGESILAQEETRLREILGDLVFGVDDETMESTVIDLLRRRRLTLGVAEPLTGGLVSARLTAVPGAGEVFGGALIPGANHEVFELLAIPEDLPVSEEAAETMALAVSRVLKTDIGLAVIGASAAGQGKHPPGTVFLGLTMGGKVQSRRLQLPGDPQRIGQFSAISLLNLLRLNLVHQPG